MVIDNEVRGALCTFIKGKEGEKAAAVAPKRERIIIKGARMVMDFYGVKGFGPGVFAG
jgi:hypothetical protein